MSAIRKEEFNSVFNYLFEKEILQNSPLDWNPEVEVKEAEDMLELIMHVGRIDKKDVSLEIEKDLLTVAASRNIQDSQGNQSSSFTKTFRLPKCADLSSVKAHLLDTCLVISMTKTDPECKGDSRQVPLD